MNYSNLELNHEAETLAQLEFNLLQDGYLIHCNIEAVRFDDLNRPYEQTTNGRIMLSNNKLIVNRH